MSLPKRHTCAMQLFVRAAVLILGMVSLQLVQGFSIPHFQSSTARPSCNVRTLSTTSTISQRYMTSLDARRKGDLEDDDDDNDEYYGDDKEGDGDDSDGGGIFARVRRRRGGRRYYDDDEDDVDREDADVGRAADRLEARGIFDRFDDDDDDDDEEEETGGILEDVLIPNPILDRIDPDGAAERFPELARDPRFWLDIFLFLAFINFVSFIGPRNPFPDLPAVMYKATLPPPGI
jgi:hypothetical protein